MSMDSGDLQGVKKLGRRRIEGEQRGWREEGDGEVWEGVGRDGDAEGGTLSKNAYPRIAEQWDKHAPRQTLCRPTCLLSLRMTIMLESR